MAELDFSVCKYPFEQLQSQLLVRFPQTHFSNMEYLAHLQSLHSSRIMAFTMHSSDTLVSTIVAYGTRRFGWKTAHLNVLGIDQYSANVFWSDVFDFLRSCGYNEVVVNSFASEPFEKPPLQHMKTKYRHEYRVPLVEYSYKAIHPKHRYSIRRAKKVGVSVREVWDSTELEIHFKMRCYSMARQSAKGENIVLPTDSGNLSNLLKKGIGALFIASLNERPVSTAFIIYSDKGAYLQTAGTSKEGTRIGSSHFLLHTIMIKLKENGMTEFNLGGADPDNKGLNRFKNRFAARQVKLASYSFNLRNGIIFKVGRLLHRLLIDPKLWFQTYILSAKRYVVYCKPTKGHNHSTDSDSGIVIRKLKYEELELLNNTEFSKSYRKYLLYQEYSEAYGAWLDGKLAHTSWLVDSQLEREFEEGNIGLKLDEVEITHCYTADECRGRGIYARMISYLIMQASHQGYNRVYMITSVDNLSSQRGIEKAGLHNIGIIIQYNIFPPMRFSWRMKHLIEKEVQTIF